MTAWNLFVRAVTLACLLTVTRPMWAGTELGVEIVSWTFAGSAVYAVFYTAWRAVT